MWEYRLFWPSTRPDWWSEVWQHGEQLLRQRGEEVENRPDTYLVISNRPDVGLKMRGDRNFEVKSLHERAGSWELWEKYPFFRWSALEAARLANMLRVKPRLVTTTESAPTKGVAEFLGRLDIETSKVQVRKSRLQATASELFAEVPGCTAAPFWLAELVEIQLPWRSTSIVSICLETLEPIGKLSDPFVADGAWRCGYPELLARQLAEIS